MLVHDSRAAWVTLTGEEEVLNNSVSTHIVSRSEQVRWVVGRLAGSRAPEPGSVGQNLTTSTVRLRRLTVEEISKGRDGEALVFDERSKPGYMELTPYFQEPWLSVVDPSPDPAPDLGRDLGRGAGGPEGPDLDFGR